MLGPLQLLNFVGVFLPKYISSAISWSPCAIMQLLGEDGKVEHCLVICGWSYLEEGVWGTLWTVSLTILHRYRKNLVFRHRKKSDWFPNLDISAFASIPISVFGFWSRVAGSCRAAKVWFWSIWHFFQISEVLFHSFDCRKHAQIVCADSWVVQQKSSRIIERSWVHRVLEVWRIVPPLSIKVTLFQYL